MPLCMGETISIDTSLPARDEHGQHRWLSGANHGHNLIPGAALQLGIPDLLLALSPFVLAFV